MRITLSSKLEVVKSILNLHFLQIVVILGLIAASFWLSSSVRGYIRSKDLSEATEVFSKTLRTQVEVIKKPLESAKITEVAKTLKAMHPGVGIEVVADTLVVSGKTPDLYERWFLALLAAQYYGGKNLVWGAPSVCIGKCENDNAMYAVIQPFKREVKTIN
jgi:hypothetical protein